MKYILVLLVIVILVYLWRRSIMDSRFLCDTCAYDYGEACRKSIRPNARKCSDYKRRGT